MCPVTSLRCRCGLILRVHPAGTAWCSRCQTSYVVEVTWAPNPNGKAEASTGLASAQRQGEG